MRYFTSDTHFGHKNIIRFCGRPFADEAVMNEALIANWNSKVKDGGIVFHLGDVALGKWIEWDGILSQLNGYKILVVGNHERIFSAESEKNRNKFSTEYPKWFDEIHTEVKGLELANGVKVNLSHFPYNGDSHDGDRFEDVRLTDYGVPLIHGHTHENKIVSHSKAGTLQVHVGMDAWDYQLVSEDELIDVIDCF